MCMYLLTMNKLPDGSYMISDHNDERLYMIGLILTDRKVRDEINNYMTHIYGLVPKQTFSVKSSDGDFTVKLEEREDETLFLTIHAKEEDHVLETDITNNMLSTLIDNMEDLISQDVNEISLTRTQDNFELHPIA